MTQSGGRARGDAALEAAIHLVEEATEQAAEVLLRLVQSGEGKVGEGKERLAQMRELCVLLMQERAKLEKLGRGKEGTGGLDLQAARDEVERRLARLSRSRSAKGDDRGA